VIMQRLLRAIRPIVMLLIFVPSFAQSLPASAAENPDLSAPNPGPGDADPGLYSPILANDREAIYSATAGRLTRYKIDATLTPAGDSPAKITGTLDLSYYNGTGKAQDSLYFRLYPNGKEYADGGLTLDQVVVNGRTIDPKLSVEDTVAQVRLSDPVNNEAVVDLKISFTTTIPNNPVGSYGMFRVETDTGTYALAHWEPLLAGYDPDSGWNLQPLSVLGDPVFTNAALYDVTLHTPSDLVVVTTGSEVDSKSDGDNEIARHFLTGPVRDFVMAANSTFVSKSTMVDGTKVNSWYRPEDESGGEAVLKYGAQSLEVYGRLFGEYPYSELDLVQVDLGGGAAGVEFPQLLFIGGSHYAADSFTQQIPGFLEFVVAHEVGHQWWYAMVGNDQYEHAFIDEGLTNYMTTVYFSEEYGADQGMQQLNLNLKLPYFSMLFGGQGDQIVDQPTDDFPNQDDYSSTIYGKAALGFDAIRTAIGDQAFFGAVKAYAAQYQFQVATPTELEAEFEKVSGDDLKQLWRHWFQAADGNKDFDANDLADLLQAIGR
jgi:hypothetical protein